MPKMVQKAVLESGWNWGLIYDMVSDCDLEVKVAHPLKVKALSLRPR